MMPDFPARVDLPAGVHRTGREREQREKLHGLQTRATNSAESRTLISFQTRVGWALFQGPNTFATRWTCGSSSG
jgi:hypothetical protein